MQIPLCKEHFFPLWSLTLKFWWSMPQKISLRLENQHRSDVGVCVENGERENQREPWPPSMNKRKYLHNCSTVVILLLSYLLHSLSFLALPYGNFYTLPAEIYTLPKKKLRCRSKGKKLFRAIFPWFNQFETKRAMMKTYLPSDRVE